MRRARDGTLNGGKFTRASSLTPLAVPLLLEARFSTATLIRSGGLFLRAASPRTAVAAIWRARGWSFLTPTRSRASALWLRSIRPLAQAGTVPPGSSRSRRTKSTTWAGISSSRGKRAIFARHLSDSTSASRWASESVFSAAQAASPRRTVK